MFTNEAFENKIAVVTDSEQQLTYLELYNQASQMFNIVEERTLVFCMCKNSIESLVGYFSFISNRVVPLMLDASLEYSLLSNLLEAYRPRYIWLESERSSEFDSFNEIYRFHGYSLLKSQLSVNVELHPSLALLLTTSGSTGSPKLVRLSYDNIKANAESIAEYLSITADERPITSLPMHYSFGLSIINSHILRGAKLLLTNHSILDKEFWQFMKNQKATSLSGVPYTYEILKRLRFFRMELPSLNTLTQAGGKLSVELHKEFADYCLVNKKRFFVMYGQTEATARMSYLPFEKTLEKLGSIGIAIPGGMFSIIDDNGSVINNVESSGELVYKGANVSLGYAECVDDLCKGNENNGILFTGDIAKRDSDDYYYIVGRKKRFIKVFGNRINLDETERLIKTIIADCACVGKDDLMVVYINEQGREKEVKQFISSKTSLNHTAFDIRYCKLIPKNSSGKTLYSNLQI